MILSKINILLLEDEDNLRKLVAKYLENEGYNVVQVDQGKMAIEELENKEFHLALLDVMLPDIDGWTVLKKMRSTSEIPVIMLTARNDEVDKLFGFELGADDYITKPFSPKEMVARVKALLLRTVKKRMDSEVVVENIRINSDQHQVYIENQIIELTPNEYELLYYLALNKNNALSREMILDNVWGYDFFGDARTVDTHIKRLRKKLGDKSDIIKAIRGFGYRLEVKEWKIP